MINIAYKFLSFLLAFLLLASCNSCNNSNLQSEVLLKAKDNVITEVEFTYLKEYAGRNPKYVKYSKPGELYSYIVNLLTRTNNKGATIWNPNPVTDAKPFNVNVYIENSESMDGYVNENDFKNDIYELLGNVKNLADSLNLNFINNIPHNIKVNATSSDNKDFILNLSKKQFKRQGGNRAVSDMSEILKSVLQKTNSRNLTILISDFVFSPGSGVDAEKYLNIQKISIRDIFKDKLKAQNLALTVYQLNAAFDGQYFDHNNKGLPYKGSRPYYIWIIGSQAQVAILNNNQVIRKSNNYLNSIVYTKPSSPESLECKIVKTGHSGNFKVSDVKDEINDAVTGEGKFEFSVAVNFSKFLIDFKYYIEPANYAVSDTCYKISIRELTAVDQQSPSLKGFSHLLTFRTNRINSEDLDVKILSKQPSWINTDNSVNDSNLQKNKQEQIKTFGLKYLLDGVNDAFNPDPDSEKNIISEFTIKIKAKL